MKTTKRTIDIILGSIALLLLLPFILVACLAVYIEDRRNPLFSHIRYGKDMSLFTLFKIRTMNVPETNDKRKIEDLQRDRRVTKVGRFLRSFHLDELPQLCSIIEGDMSFVGPRPIPVIMKVDGILNWEARSVIRPGLTGMAQLYCTKYTSLARKFHFDVLYVKKQSLWLDFKLMLATSKMIMPLVAFVGWTSVILLATLLPIAEESIPGAGVFGFDKLAHFGLFMVWAITAYWFFHSFILDTVLLLGIIVLVGSFFGSVTEIGQMYLPTRQTSVWDYAADMAGILYIILLLIIARATVLCKKES